MARHIYDDKLPSSIHLESELSYINILNLFEQANHGNWKYLVRGAKQLKDASDIKCPLTSDIRRKLIACLMHKLSLLNIPMFEECRLFESLSTLLDDMRVKHIGLESVVDWRWMLEKFLKAHKTNGRTVAKNNKTLVQRHRRSMLALMRELRHHYQSEVALEVWEYCSPALKVTQQQHCFEALCVLQLMSPTVHDHYDDLVPKFLEYWKLVEKCPEWDLLWLSMLCRARKHTKQFNWEKAQHQLFGCLQQLLLVKFGDSPVIGDRKSPAVIVRLFLSDYDIQVSRVSKIAKMVTFCMARESGADGREATEPNSVSCGDFGPTSRLLRMLNLGRVYFYPSNASHCTGRLVAFTQCLMDEVAKSVGRSAANRHVRCLSPSQVFLLLDVLTPLLQQGVFSQNRNISAASISTLRTIAFLSPNKVGPPLIEFMVLSMGEQSVNSTHMFPAGVNLLTSLLQPLLHPHPLLASALPSLLHSSLQGIDPNNQTKTMNTLSMYKELLQWVYVKEEGCFHPLNLDNEWYSQFDVQGEDHTENITYLGQAIVHWAPEFMNKLFYMFQSQEAPAESSASLDQRLMTRQSLLIRELSLLFFRSLEKNVFDTCATMLVEFVMSRQVLNAAKDVAFVVQGCVAANPSVFPLFAEPLLEGVASEGALTTSERAVVWRLRIISGAIRFAGIHCLTYGDKLIQLLDVTTEHMDKYVSKYACKVLRSVLQGLSESYPLTGSMDCNIAQSSWCDFKVSWHECRKEELEYALQLLDRYLLKPLALLGSSTKVRRERFLRKVLQCIRGGAGLLHDIRKGVNTCRADDSVFDTGSAYGRLDCDVALLQEIRQLIAKELHNSLNKEGGDDSIKQTKLWLKCAYATLTMRGAVAHLAKAMVNRYRSIVEFYEHPVIAAESMEKLKSVLSKEHTDQDIHEIYSVGRFVPKHLKYLRIWGHFAYRQEVGSRLFVSSMRDAERSEDHNRDGLHHVLATKLNVYDELIGDIVSLSQGQYATVRAAAQRHLPWASFTWILRRRLEDVVQFVGGGGSYEQCAGAVYILLDTRAIRKVASDDQLVSQLLLRICQSAQLSSHLISSNRERVVALCFELLGTYLSQWQERSADVSVAAPLETALLALFHTVQPEEAHEMDGQSLSWRHELAATWCLLHCFRGDHAPCLGSWRHFIKCLSCGDGHPQQKLGLYALTKLISLHLDGVCGVDTEVINLLKLQGNCNSLLVALAFDRRGGAAKGLWSSGVTTIVNEASQLGNPIFPKSRLPLVSVMFKSKHARFAKHWFRLVGTELMVQLEESFQWVLGGRALDPADRRNFTCAISEVIAGLLREATNTTLNESELKSVWGFALPVLEGQMSDASFEIAADWADAVRFIVAKRKPFHMSPLVMTIVKHVKADLNDGGDRNDYATQAKWLRLLQSLLAEWGCNPDCEVEFCQLAEDIVPRLISVFAHPYQLFRNMVAKTLFLFLDASHFASSSRVSKLRDESLCKVLNVLRQDLPKQESDPLPTSKVIRLSRETAGNWLLTCAVGGDTGVHGWYIMKLLLPLFKGLLDEDVEHQQFTRSVLRFLSQAVGKSLDTITSSALTSDASWKVREEAVRFIGVCNMRLDGSSSEVIRTMFPLMGDERLEVSIAAREVASLVFMADLPTEIVCSTLKGIMNKASRLLKHLKRCKSIQESSTCRNEHSLDVRYCVNGLGALVLSCPFDMPEAVVPVIGVLARLASMGGDEARASVRHCFMEFKRTHLDNWDEHRMNFDEGTLDAFNETFEAPSYFC